MEVSVSSDGKITVGGYTVNTGGSFSVEFRVASSGYE